MVGFKGNTFDHIFFWLHRWRFLWCLGQIDSQEICVSLCGLLIKVFAVKRPGLALF